jgi:hypothetical protein
MEMTRIDGVMVSVLASCVVDRGFEPRSDQNKDFIIGICCFSSMHVDLLQSRYRHHLIELLTCSRNDIVAKLLTCIFDIHNNRAVNI